MRMCLLFLLVVASLCRRVRLDAGEVERARNLGRQRRRLEGEASSEGRTVRLHGVSFHSKDYVFRVVDNPPQDPQSLPSALARVKAFAGSNGGYLHNDHTPLGLVVVEGKTFCIPSNAPNS